MPYTWKCLKKAPFVAFPLLVLAVLGRGALGGSQDKLLGGLVFILVGMLFFGLLFDLVRWLGLMVRWLHRSATGG